MTDWYYSDYERNRHGPVAARDLADLHHAGQLQPDTLVWREGMPQWRPWREVMNEALNEAAGRTSPAVEATPLSAGVNPYAMAEPRAATTPEGTAAATTSTLSAGVNPYAVAESQSPYAPPRASLHNSTDYVGGGEVVYAGFWKRFAAYTIDSFALSIVFGVIGGILGVAGFFGAAAGTNDPAVVMGRMGTTLVGFYLIEIVGMALYFAMMHSSSRQATLGKMAVGIKVTDDNGQPITFWRGIGRFFATAVSILTLYIGYIMAGFTDRKRALHDMIASTLVVDQWAYTAHPERQRHDLGVVTIVILVIAGVLVLAYIGLIVALIGMAASAGIH
ncbi:MAG TPA: RDD family protein [Lysobacter sp.]|nr:RDD family protein [Lysobacter sp.]